MSPDDDLRSLPAVEPPRELERRVRGLARAELEASAGPAWRALGGRLLRQVAIPAAVTVTVVGYLHWAVEAAGALYR